jgi:hypothetical protein
MTHREERTGGVIAGAVLLALSALDALLGAGSLGLVQLVVGGFGATLIALSRSLR